MFLRFCWKESDLNDKLIISVAVGEFAVNGSSD